MMRFTVKEWKRFSWEKQERLCARYEVILTDHKNKPTIKDIIKGINFRNFDRGMKIFDGSMKEFSNAMTAMTNELGSAEVKKKTPIWSKKKVGLGSGKATIWSKRKGMKL